MCRRMPVAGPLRLFVTAFPRRPERRLGHRLASLGATRMTTEALATEMFDVGHHFLQCYKALANQAIRDNKKLWSWKPKLHYYEHFLDILNQEKINYVYLWNFSEEDLIGTSSSIASMTHRLVVPSRTLGRYYIRRASVWGSRNVVSTGPPEWL